MDATPALFAHRAPMPTKDTRRPSAGFAHESTRNESIEWYTPPSVFDALGLSFDLDPCSPGVGRSHVPARKHYTIHDDGLNSPWEGTAFVNPPYGSETQHWMRKLADHGDGIALVFARTDVKWFHEVAPKTSLICFVSGRIKFYKGNTVDQGGTPGAGSMLIAFGPRAADAVRESGLGVCVEVSHTFCVTEDLNRRLSVTNDVNSCPAPFSPRAAHQHNLGAHRA